MIDVFFCCCCFFVASAAAFDCRCTLRFELHVCVYGCTVCESVLECVSCQCSVIPSESIRNPRHYIQGLFNGLWMHRVYACNEWAESRREAAPFGLGIFSMPQKQILQIMAVGSSTLHSLTLCFRFELVSYTNMAVTFDLLHCIYCTS